MQRFSQPYPISEEYGLNLLKPLFSSSKQNPRMHMSKYSEMNYVFKLVPTKKMNITK